VAPTAAAVPITARRFCRRATPATLIGESGRPTRASAFSIDSDRALCSDQFTENSPANTKAEAARLKFLRFFSSVFSLMHKAVAMHFVVLPLTGVDSDQEKWRTRLMRVTACPRGQLPSGQWPGLDSRHKLGTIFINPPAGGAHDQSDRMQVACCAMHAARQARSG
jgi:hypothetical protein